MNTKAPVKTKREIQELSLLFEISQALNRSIVLQNVVDFVLKTMAKRMGMLRGTLTLLNRKTGEISIDAAYGLSLSQKQRGKYKLGEGVTGKVVQTGQSAVVPRISEEPLFLNRTRARKGLRKSGISFICVPIKLGRETIGTLSADRLFAENISLNEDVRLLLTIASMVAQEVHRRQQAQEERQRLFEENVKLREALKERFRPSNIIGNSKAMQAVYELIARVAGSDATVLLRGESGTGKELVAHAIHYNSARAAKQLIKVNCAAIPETLLESEFFGHEKGAFTDAVSQRKGRFELADGGTIFLDEVGDLSPATQAKLLRVLQEKEFERVGGADTIKVDVRVIAATNKNLERLIEKGKFRKDLYYRLNVFPIYVPLLRERRVDILLLANHFVEKYSKSHNKTILRISALAIDMLIGYRWPGNVRELENCIERAVLLNDDGIIHGHHLPLTLQTAETSGTKHTGTLQAALDSMEHEILFDALKSSQGNMVKAARSLGLTERIIGLRVKKHRINPKQFRT